MSCMDADSHFDLGNARGTQAPNEIQFLECVQALESAYACSIGVLIHRIRCIPKSHCNTHKWMPREGRSVHQPLNHIHRGAEKRINMREELSSREGGLREQESSTDAVAWRSKGRQTEREREREKRGSNSP